MCLIFTVCFLLAENDRVRYDKLMVDDYLYTTEEFELGLEMRKALRKEAEKDQFLAVVLAQSDTQKFMVNKQQEFYYGNFAYHLDIRRVVTVGDKMLEDFTVLF